MSKSLYEDLMKGYRNELLPRKQLNEGISITVDDEDAEQLLQLLTMAGINHASADEVEIEVVDEQESQQMDYPTNPETFSDTPTLSAYSGGLNAPKTTTGQSTTPILASQKNRQHTYEDVDLERTLFKLYQQYKGE